MNQRARTPETGRLPNVRAGKYMSVIETRRSVVKFVAVWIVQRKGRISRVKARNSFAKWEVVEALRVRIVREDRESVGHALLDGSLQRVVAGVDVVDIG